MNPLEIGGRPVGPTHPCFVVAEAGVNHNGSLDHALRLVDAARDAGADAVKFQLYRVSEQVSRAAATAPYQQAQTGATTQEALATFYDLPWEAHVAIAAHCRARGILYLASCFDPRAVDFLLGLGADAIKIGSGEITNVPLLRHAARTGRTVLLSTGMCSLADVEGAVDTLHAHGNARLALFHCTSSYPADPASINLRAMETLARAFGVPVGLSDHTEGNAVAIAAVALGASLIEKHLTLDRTLPGPDHRASTEPDGFRDLVAAIRAVESALGDGVKRLQDTERPVRTAARRSLVASRPIAAGEPLTEDNVTLKRPATGIDPRMWEVAMGRRAAVDIPADEPIAWEMLA